jgi:hypothetical protein
MSSSSSAAERLSDLLLDYKFHCIPSDLLKLLYEYMNGSNTSFAGITDPIQSTLDLKFEPIKYDYTTLIKKIVGHDVYMSNISKKQTAGLISSRNLHLNSYYTSKAGAIET